MRRKSSATDPVQVHPTPARVTPPGPALREPRSPAVLPKLRGERRRRRALHNMGLLPKEG